MRKLLKGDSPQSDRRHITISIPRIPPFALVGIGLAIVVVSSLGLLWTGVNSISWNWLTFILAAVVVGVIGAIIGIITDKWSIIAFTVVVSVSLLFGSCVSGWRAWMRFISLPMTVEPESETKWKVTINNVAQSNSIRDTSTKVRIPPGKRARIIGPASYWVTCETNNLLYPDRFTHVITLTRDVCPGEIGIHVIDASFASAVYTIEIIP